MKLLIISHTEHYLVNNEVRGWNATIREIDQLASIFDHVTHLAPLHNTPAPPSSAAYTASNISFQPLTPSGGDGFINKLKIIFYVIPNLIKINRACGDADIIHFRAPTNLGVYTLPFLWFYKHKMQWVKYAGNWVQENKPWSYRFQQWWMIKNFNKGIGTINGHWPNQPNHLHTFENPCLSQAELTNAQQTQRNWNGKLTVCFAASLNPEKGAIKILEALQRIDNAAARIEKVIFAGDGKERAQIENFKSNIPFELRGYLNKKEVFEMFANAHLIILPTRNEGFPKTIAEAMAYGCIPLVTDVSCIGQYINNSNGVLLADDQVETLQMALQNLILLTPETLQAKSEEAKKIASLFSYEYYLSKLRRIFKI